MNFIVMLLIRNVVMVQEIYNLEIVDLRINRENNPLN